MKRMTIAALAAMLVTPALAGDLELSIVRTDCRPTFSANTIIQFDILGEVTGTSNDGLALFAFDLSAQLDGQSFDVTSATVTAPTPDMDAFAVRGLTNPAGFGGTPVGNLLVQIGAGQNTINNPGPVPPFPEGDVDFWIGLNGPQVLASVSIILSATPTDRYIFTVGNGGAFVIKEGEMDPPLAVEAAVSVTGATLEIVPLTCPLDYDGDGQINSVDSGLVQAQYGCFVGTGDCECDRADMDGDGAVNPVDSGLVQGSFGIPCP